MSKLHFDISDLRRFSLSELMAAGRICCEGWSAEFDSADGADEFVRAGDSLFWELERRIGTEPDAADRCRMVCLMYELMTGVGEDWSAQKDSAFVSAFLSVAADCAAEACATDGMLRALLCRASAYNLYCQTDDVNPKIHGFAQACVAEWLRCLSGNRWAETPMPVAVERIAALRAVAMTEADADLLKVTDSILEKYARQAVGSDVSICLKSRLVDLLLECGKFPQIVAQILAEKTARSGGCSKSDSLVLQSMQFAFECRQMEVNRNFYGIAYDSSF